MEIINPEKLLLKIVPILDKLKIDYFITGGFAVSVWGRPRATFDIDIVLALREPEISDLAKAIKAISKSGYFDEDMAREAIRNNGEFNFIDPETGIKVDFWAVKNDERAKLEFKRKIAKKIDGQKICFASPEDLILNKLLWYKESGSTRHLEDIESILKISKLDKKYLNLWAARLDIMEILGKLIIK